MIYFNDWGLGFMFYCCDWYLFIGLVSHCNSVVRYFDGVLDIT